MEGENLTGNLKKENENSKKIITGVVIASIIIVGISGLGYALCKAKKKKDDEEEKKKKDKEEWSEWGPCSKLCDEGTQTRVCKLEGGCGDNKDLMIQTQKCNQEPCEEVLTDAEGFTKLPNKYTTRNVVGEWVEDIPLQDAAEICRNDNDCGGFVYSMPSMYSNIEAKVTHGSYKKISTCLLYTSPSPRDLSTSRMPSSA